MAQRGSDMVEPEGLRLLQEVYETRRRTGSLLEGVLSLAGDDIEWWAAGPPEIRPWAGTWRGKKGVAKRFHVLNESIEYHTWEPFEYIAQGETVVELIRATE